MSSARVVNKHTAKPEDLVNGFYIGRGSEWGNPYTHLTKGLTKASVQVATRDEACDAYEIYIRDRLAKEPGLMERLLLMKDSVLICYCAPQRCHGDTLIKIINEQEM